MTSETAFLLSQLARAFLLPPAGLFLLLFLGLIVRRRLPRAGRALVTASVVLGYVLSTTLGAWLLVAPLEARVTPLADPRGAGAQAIVVLSAGHLRDAPEYGGRDIPDAVALARLRYAAKLQHETGLPLLVTGGNPSRDRTEGEGETMARALREDFRTPVQWVESRSRNTAENATMTADILERDAVKRVLLVTDAMHMPRAAERFVRAGLDVVPAPTQFLARGGFVWRDLVPSAEAMRRSYYATYEWIGLAWYAIRYR